MFYGFVFPLGNSYKTLYSWFGRDDTGGAVEYKIEKKKRINSGRYHQSDLDLAYQFAKDIHKEFKTFIRAIILFGSTARQKHKGHDIDIMLVIDDLSMQLTKELIQTYRIITEQVIARVSVKLHVTTLRLTSFWEYVRSGDPVIINVLRDGFAILDTGFFDPLQALLYQGRIRPTPESMWSYFEKAPVTLQNANWHIMQGTLDLYWAVVDAAHAALMKLNQIPPSPQHVADLLDEVMVKKNLLDKRYSHTMREFYHLSKMITHGNVQHITGSQYDKYSREAKEFVDEMERFLKK